MRFHRVFLALLCAGSLIGATPAPAPTAESAIGLHLSPCPLGKTKIPAQCGTFGVYEDRAAKTGRVIPLHVVVIPAAHPSHRAIAIIAGGPGQASTEFAPYILATPSSSAYVTLHDTYDFIFMDDRGMGTSNPFPCNFAPPGDPASYFRYLFPPQLVAQCRAQSERTHDLSQYNTNNATDDLDDIRAALGYDKIVLSGGSYGTLFSMVYMRRHPEHVESAVLDGVAPPGFQPLPGEPMGAQQAVNDLFVKCKTNAACNAHFPQFREHFAALMKRLDAGPINVPARNLVTKKTQTVALTKSVFVDTLRHLLYDPEGASYVPLMVERAYHGDYRPLAHIMQFVLMSFATALNDGAYLSYSCADMMPFVSESAVRFAAAYSFAGDLRIREQQKACSIWGVPAMPATFNQPLRSDLPVLMLLGSDDPATPAHYGLAALKDLPNGRAVVVKGGGHGADTACTDKLVLQFIKASSAKGLDLSKCTATFTLPPFKTGTKGVPPLP